MEGKESTGHFCMMSNYSLRHPSLLSVAHGFLPQPVFTRRYYVYGIKAVDNMMGKSRGLSEHLTQTVSADI